MPPTRSDADRATSCRSRSAQRLRHAHGDRRASSTPRASSRSSRCSRRSSSSGFARLDGQPVGIVANNPMQKGGVLFVDSADKAARFIWLCDAFNVPLVFLADVPGFMIGTDGRAPGHHPPRRQDDHRGHRGDGAQGVGDRAQGVRRRALRHVRARPSTRSRRIALPTAKIAVMGPEAAVNAVYRQQDRRDRRRRRAERRSSPSSAREYEEDVDLLRLASELVVDAVVDFERLRDELVASLRRGRGTRRAASSRSATACPPCEPRCRGATTARSSGTPTRRCRTAPARPAVVRCPRRRRSIRVR